MLTVRSITATSLNRPVTILMELSQNVSKEAPRGQTSDPSPLLSAWPGATAMFLAVLALAA